MLVTLLVKFRNKDCKITELGLLLQVLPVRIVTFVETLGSHLKPAASKDALVWASSLLALQSDSKFDRAVCGR